MFREQLAHCLLPIPVGGRRDNNFSQQYSDTGKHARVPRTTGDSLIEDWGMWMRRGKRVWRWKVRLLHMVSLCGELTPKMMQTYTYTGLSGLNLVGHEQSTIISLENARFKESATTATYACRDNPIYLEECPA